MTGESVIWPLGTDGTQTLLVLGADAELLRPVLGGEPRRMIPAGIPDLEVDTGELAIELSSGPDHIFMLIERSDRAYDFYADLWPALYACDCELETAFLPVGMALEELIAALPSGRDAVAPGERPRDWHLRHALFTLWARDAPDERLREVVLNQVAGFSQDLR